MPATAEPPVISPEKLYPLASLKKLLGWGNWALRSARRQSPDLVRYVAGRGYVRGADLIRHVEQHGTTVKPHGRQGNS